MIIVGKRYEVIYEGKTTEYSRRGHYGGTGYVWSGVVRVQTRRGKLVAIFRLNADVSTPSRFSPAFLFTHSLGDHHYDAWIEALPGKRDALVDYIAMLLVVHSREGFVRQHDKPLAGVGFSGLTREQAMQMGFVADREGQVAMRV